LFLCSSLANKQDKADALDKNTILEDLKIERLVNENQTLCRVVKMKITNQLNICSFSNLLFRNYVQLHQ
jgi:hypothetical protein